MKFLIVAATSKEISPMLSYFNLTEETFIRCSKFDILLTGVGMTATAFSMGRHIKDSYTHILNVGIAGSFKDVIKIGDLVTVKKDTFSELGAEEDINFLSIDQLGFGKSTFFSTAVNPLKAVSAITVNTVHGSEGSILKIENRLHPDIESMEGAAVFYCAEQLGIPAFQVRCISNAVQKRDKSQWNIPLAIKNLNDWLINYIETHS